MCASTPSCSSFFLLCLQMVQAIQVLRFHLLELEKVRVSHLHLPYPFSS